MKLGIYILLFNRMNLLHMEQMLDSLLLSKYYNKKKVRIYVIDDLSDSKIFLANLNKLKSKYCKEVTFRRNNSRLGIINNPINIFKTASEDYISLLADDDTITNLYLDFFFENYNLLDADVSSLFFTHYEQQNDGKIEKKTLKQFVSKFSISRRLSFLYNQNDMYLYGFHNIKIIREFIFCNFLLFNDSPTSWAYELIFFILGKGKILVLNVEPIWIYNGQSIKYYKEYNEGRKIIWLIKYFFRELELHFKYTKYQCTLTFLIILQLPIILTNKFLRRHVFTIKK